MEKYDSITAFHYKYFRPPVHKQILNRALGSSKFSKALDVGCGTGQSSIALTHFCNKVAGYDPNLPMLKEAKAHPSVDYYSDLDLNNQFNLLCFFGSINYINQLEISQLINLLVPKGTIVCCDFDLQFPSLIKSLLEGSEQGNYNPAKDLSLYEIKSLKEIEKGNFNLSFQSSIKDTAHLILGDSNFLSHFQNQYGLQDPYEDLVEKLRNNFSVEEITHSVKAYWVKYK